MSRYSKAYSSFCVGLGEVKQLRKLASQLELERNRLQSGNIERSLFGSQSEITGKANALCRGAIVLLSSHIEGYVKSLLDDICECIDTNDVDATRLGDQLRYHLSADLVKEIREARDPQVVTNKLIAIDGRYRGATSGAPSDHSVTAKSFLIGFSTPRPEKIYNLFSKLGLVDLEGKLGAALQGEYSIITPSVDTLVVSRNDVAHGDLSSNFTASQIELYCKHVQRYVRSIDEVVCTWFKSANIILR